MRLISSDHPTSRPTIFMFFGFDIPGSTTYYLLPLLLLLLLLLDYILPSCLCEAAAACVSLPVRSSSTASLCLSVSPINSRLRHLGTCTYPTQRMRPRPAVGWPQDAGRCRQQSPCRGLQDHAPEEETTANPPSTEE